MKALQFQQHAKAIRGTANSGPDGSETRSNTTMSQARAADGKFRTRRDEDEDGHEGPTDGDEQTSTREQETTAQAGMHGRNETEAETPRPTTADVTEKAENKFSQAGVEKTVEARRGSPKNEKEAQEMREKLQQMEDELWRLEQGYPTPPQEKNQRMREFFRRVEGQESADAEESVEPEKPNEGGASSHGEESSNGDSSEEEEKRKKKKKQKKKKEETEESTESERSDEDSSDSSDEESTASDSSEEEKKKKKKKKKKREESEEETDWSGEKTEELEALMRAFGEEARSSFERTELSALLSNVVVDDLQEGLKTAMASRTRIGSLSNLVKTIKEKMPVEVKRFKFQSKQKGHKVKQEVMEFMMKLVVQEHLHRALAAMVVTRLWAEDDERYSRAVVDVMRQSCMADGRSGTVYEEWKDHEEDCKQGRLQTKLLDVRAGEAKEKKGYDRLNPVGRKMRKAKKREKRREQLRQLGEAWSQVVISTASYLSYVAKEKVKYDALIEDWMIKSQDHRLVQRRNETVSELLGRHRDAKRDLGIELQRIGKQHKFPDVEVCVKQLVLAGNADIRAALQARMLREQLDEETMDEEEVETLMLDIERWAEKSKMSGYAQPASHRTPPGRQDSGGGAKGGGKGDRGNVRPGQQCRFGESCGDPACWSKMTHKDRQGGMLTLCRYGDGCRDLAKGTCRRWHPKKRNFGGGGVTQVKEMTKMDKAKRAYAKNNMMLFKNVEDRLIPPEDVERLAKSYDEGHAEVRMHAMRRSTERLVTEKTADGKEIGVTVDGVRMELPTPNCYSIQNGSWGDLAPRDGRARMGFNMEEADDSRRTAVEQPRLSADGGKADLEEEAAESQDEAHRLYAEVVSALEEMTEEHTPDQEVEREELRSDRTAMKVTGMILDAGAMRKAMQSRDMMEKAVWSAVWEISKAKIDAASAKGTRTRQRSEEVTAQEQRQVVSGAGRTEETEAAANGGKMEAAAAEGAVLEESMGELADVEQRIEGRTTGRIFEQMMTERWIAVATRWREEQQRMQLPSGYSTGGAEGATAQRYGAAGEGGESSE